MEHIIVVPGNAGIALGLSKISNRAETAANDYPNLVLLAKRLGVFGPVVVGPDDAIVDGIEMHFTESRIPCFARTK